MFKKLLIVSAILATTSGVALAHSYKGERDYKGEVAPACPTCATYCFMSGPYVGLSVGARNNYTSLPVVYRGIEGTLSLGYAGVITPSLYLAGEFFAGDSFQVREYSPAGLGVRSTWSYGLSVIPGVMLTDYVMAYFRAGATRTRFNNISTNRTAWHIGFGGQANLAPNWDVRAEYVYSLYGSTSAIAQPQADLVNVGVVYKFSI